MVPTIPPKSKNVLISMTAMAWPTIDRLGEPIEVLEVADADVVLHALPPTIYNGGVLVVSELRVACPFSLGAQVRAATTLRLSGVDYRYGSWASF